jgi:clan AA aspartic protease
VKGHVDPSRRALVEVSIGNSPTEHTTTVEVWIDTGFDGHLVLPRSLIERVALEFLTPSPAILADGNKVELDMFYCYLRWFDQILPVTVVANDGHAALLGTELLKDCRLFIDYPNQSVEIE